MTSPLCSPPMATARVMVVLALVLTGCAARHVPGDLHRLDEKNGFRDARLEASLTEFPDLEPAGKIKDLRCFRRKDEDLEVSGATMSRIRYCFYDNRLASVMMWGVGADVAGDLLNSMREQYGKGEQLNARNDAGPQPIGEIWRGARVTAVLLYVDRQSFMPLDDGEVLVTLSSNRLLAQRDAEKKLAAPAAP